MAERPVITKRPIIGRPVFLAAAGIVAVLIAFVVIRNNEATKALERGEDLVAWNRPQEAIEYLEFAKKRRPNDLLINRQLYEALRRMKDYESASQLAEKSLALARSDAEKREWLGALALAQVKNGDVQSAREIASRMLAVDSKDLGAYVLLLEISQNQGRHSEAITHGERSLKLWGEQYSKKLLFAMYARLAYSYIVNGKHDEARRVIERGLPMATSKERRLTEATRKPSLDRPLIALQAVIQEADGKGEVARETWQQVLNLGHGNEDGLSNLARQRIDTLPGGETIELPPVDVLVEQFD